MFHSYATTISLTSYLWELLFEPSSYRTFIYILLYLTHSSREISYAVLASLISQFLDAPTIEHMLVGLHALKFFKTNSGQGLFLSSSFHNDFLLYHFLYIILVFLSFLIHFDESLSLKLVSSWYSTCWCSEIYYYK